MVDKNLFPYELAVVTIIKNEAPYVKEWLDYHLLAGADHFYIYDNDSTDNLKDILQPYIYAGTVTYIFYPGKVRQMEAYNDAAKRFRFFCRYMTWIDADEFVFPKSKTTIPEVVDEILTSNPDACAVAANILTFGSNKQDKADYTRGVLERFTRCAPNDLVLFDTDGMRGGNVYVKVIANPRSIQSILSPHFANYFQEKFAVNSNGECVVPGLSNDPPITDKISVNHYFTKSREEFALKYARGRATNNEKWPIHIFLAYDQNKVFDDSILKYRAARTKSFSFESEEQRTHRVINSLVRTLTQPFPENTSPEFFPGKAETFLTCRAVAEKFQVKIGEYSAEELAFVKIYQLLIKGNFLTKADVQLFIEVLPEIISRPFQQVKSIQQIFSRKILPVIINVVKNSQAWMEYKNFRNLQRLLDSIKL